MNSEEITENINKVNEKTILDTTLGLYSVFMGWIYLPLIIFAIISALLASLLVIFIITIPFAITVLMPLYLLMDSFLPVTCITGLIIFIICILTKEINLKSLKLDLEKPFKIFVFFIYWLGFLLYWILAFSFIVTGDYATHVDWQFCLIFSIVLACLFFCIKKHSYFLMIICVLVMLNLNSNITDINNHIKKLVPSKLFKGFIKVEMPNVYKYYRYYSRENLCYKISDNKYLFFAIDKKEVNLIGIINTKTYKFENYIIEKNYFIRPITQLPDGNIYIMVQNDNKKGLYPAVFDVKEFKIKNIDYEKNFSGYECIKLENDNILFYIHGDIINNPNKTKSYKYFKSVIYDIHTGEYTESFEYPSLKGHDGIALNDDEIFFITKYGTNDDPSREIAICSIKNKTCKSHKIEDGQFDYTLNLFKNKKGQILIFNKKQWNHYDVSLFEPKDNSLKLINDNIENASRLVNISRLNDGNILITNGETGEMKIYDTETYKINTLERKLKPEMYEHSVIMLDDNKILILGRTSELSAWEYPAEIMML